MNNIIRWATTLGVATILGGLISLVPAQAQGSHIRNDFADIQRDERKIDDLYRQRRRQEDRHDWRGIERTDREIDALRRHIEQDRRDVHVDIHRANDDRNRNRDNSYNRDNGYGRDQNRNRSRDDNYQRDQNTNRYRDDNGSYRDNNRGSYRYSDR